MIEKEIKEILEPEIKEILETMEIGTYWMMEFAWFQKTGEKELTLKIRIHAPHIDTATHIQTVEEILSNIGWTYCIADDVKDAGQVTKTPAS